MYASNYNFNANYDRDHCLGDGEFSKIVYCGDFTNNLLVIGQAGSGKTTFVETLLANGFVKSDDIVWVSSEKLTDDVRASYHDRFKCFENFSFYIVSSGKDVNRLLLNLLPQMKERYQLEKRRTVMVFDDLLNIADKSDEYTHFLANSRHFGVITIHIFQAFRNTDRWDNIKSNCQMLVLFKLSLQAKRVISQVADIIIGHNEGIPKKESWLYRLFVDVVLNSTTYRHLLIDLRAEADFTPSRFRSQTANPHTQLCYFDSGRHKTYITYRAVRKKQEGTKSRCFQIISIIYKNLLSGVERSIARRSGSNLSRKRKRKERDSGSSSNRDTSDSENSIDNEEEEEDNGTSTIRFEKRKERKKKPCHRTEQKTFEEILDPIIEETTTIMPVNDNTLSSEKATKIIPTMVEVTTVESGEVPSISKTLTDMDNYAQQMQILEESIRKDCKLNHADYHMRAFAGISTDFEAMPTEDSPKISTTKDRIMGILTSPQRQIKKALVRADIFLLCFTLMKDLNCRNTLDTMHLSPRTRNLIKLLWRKVLPQSFTGFVHHEDVVTHFSPRASTFLKRCAILNKYFDLKENLETICQFVIERSDAIRYIYSNTHAEVYFASDEGLAVERKINHLLQINELSERQRRVVSTAMAPPPLPLLQQQQQQ